MSTKITDLHAALADLVERTLDSDYRRIPNPYFLEGNADLILEKGFGLAIGPGEKLPRELSRMTFRRVFNLILVRLVASTDHDVNARTAVELALLEDLQAIRLEIDAADQTLGGLAVSTDYETDSGLQFLLAQSVKFYALSITLSVTYDESIS